MGDLMSVVTRFLLMVIGAVALVGGLALVVWIRWGPGIDMTPERRLVEFLPYYAMAMSMLALSLASFTGARQG